MQAHIKWRGKWIVAEVTPSPKGQRTVRYVVHSMAGAFLGLVKWHDAWRCYAFFPDTGAQTIFEPTCLHDIANFVQACTELQRDIQRGKKSPCCGKEFAFKQIAGTRLVREVAGKKVADGRCPSCQRPYEVRA